MPRRVRQLGTYVKVAGRKRAESVAEMLRNQIGGGIWKPGDSLPAEPELIKAFGVSRPSVREAMRILESEGLLKVTAGRRGGAKILMPKLEIMARYAGIYLQMNNTALEDIFSARMLVEPTIIRDLTEEGNEEVISSFERCVKAQLKTSDRTVFREIEVQFKALLTQHSPSTTLKLVSKVLNDVVDWHYARLPNIPRAPADLKANLRAKVRLIAAMREGDAASAEAIWRQYIKRYTHMITKGSYNGESVDLFGPVSGRKRGRDLARASNAA